MESLKLKAKETFLLSFLLIKMKNTPLISKNKFAKQKQKSTLKQKKQIKAIKIWYSCNEP